MKTYIFSNHAKKRLYERDITEEQVKITIQNADHIIKRFGETEAFKKFGTKLLKVVYAEMENYIKVITLYYLE